MEESKEQASDEREGPRRETKTSSTRRTENSSEQEGQGFGSFFDEDPSADTANCSEAELVGCVSKREGERKVSSSESEGRDDELSSTQDMDERLTMD